MRIQKSLGILALACALSLGFAQAGNAANDQAAQGFPCPYYNGQLTPDQQAKAVQIFQDNYAGMNATRQTLAAKRAELDAQLASPTPDRAAIERLSREVGELRGKMLSARVALRAELEKNGLPTDFYAPNAPGPNGGPDMAPPPYYGGHHGRGPGHGPRHGWGAPMMRGWYGPCGGCWNGY